MKNLITLLIYLSLLAFATSTQASIPFNILESTPVGSWQLREEITTNKKGKQTGATIRTSMVGQEERNGELHYWLETSIQEFKISKKGKRKNRGSKAIIKSLIPARLFSEDPANIIENMAAIGVETIIQSGNEAPMRMGESGAMLQGAAQAMNLELRHDFSEQGEETIDVPAGSFIATKIYGEGEASMKILFKKMHVESKTTSWMSSKVPFGVVKHEGETITNGKNPTQTVGTLIEFGMSGAQSEITGEIQDAPEMPKLGDLFGG